MSVLASFVVYEREQPLVPSSFAGGRARVKGYPRRGSPYRSVVWQLTKEVPVSGGCVSSSPMVDLTLEVLVVIPLRDLWP